MDTPWFKELRKKLDEHHIGVRWQNGFHHITVVFIYEGPTIDRLESVFDKCLEGRVAPCLTFDKVDVFSISQGRFIIYLTAEHPSYEFMTLVNDIRNAVKVTGCIFDDNYKLHVTLGRVYDESIEMKQLNEITSSISIPSFTFQLPEVRYMEYRFKEIATWTMSRK